MICIPRTQEITPSTSALNELNLLIENVVICGEHLKNGNGDAIRHSLNLVHQAP